MRSSLLALAVIAGVAGLADSAGAAPALPIDGASAPAQVELVQYYGGRDYRRGPPGYYRQQEWRRRQAFRQERRDRRHAFGGYSGYRYYR